MIALYARDERSRFGVESILASEKIPYRRVACIDDARVGELLVVCASDLTERESARVAARPSVVLVGGSTFARSVFRVRSFALRTEACRVQLGSRLWPQRVVDVAADAGETELRLPWLSVAEVDGLRCDAVLASSGDDRPVVVRRGDCVWCLADVGEAFFSLITESYLPRPREPRAASRPRRLLSALVHRAYYAVPDPVRRAARALLYRDARGRLDGLDETTSRYPVDCSGWLLLELVASLCRVAGPLPLIRMERWPAPYASAAAITHDIEPTRYAYTRGLDRMLAHAAVRGRRAPAHAPATFGLVARPAARHLRGTRLDRVAQGSVLCHGLAHLGETADGDLPRTTAYVVRARAVLERVLGRAVVGYRSPRLDRSAHLAVALDAAGFEYDSSWPDVDRENVRHFGAGVRLNVPFRPPIENPDGSLRESRCLEMPLAAPDCIQPLFAGEDEGALRAAIRAKARFVRAAGGCHVALVHAGVFGPADADLREQVLAYTLEQLDDARTWIADLGALCRWWTKREAVRVAAGADCAGRTVTITAGDEPVEGLCLVVETDEGRTRIEVPPLEAGQSVTLQLEASPETLADGDVMYGT